MTLTARDKKLVLMLVPVLLVAGYWFLLLAPQRKEAARLGDVMTQVAAERDQVKAAEDQAQRTKGGYASDYATVVRLGKAIPSEVDLPSLIVQLDAAAKETDITFSKIAAGPRTTVASPSTAAAPTDGASAAPASEAGGAPASTAPGGAVEDANETAAAADPSAAMPSASAPGLESVPITVSLQGTFFDLADFFHQMKRFVRLTNGEVSVNGRLMAVDGFTFSLDEFPQISAEMQVSAYLAPKTEGTTAGATDTGPVGAPADSGVPTDPTAAPAATESTGVSQ